MSVFAAYLPRLCCLQDGICVCAAKKRTNAPCLVPLADINIFQESTGGETEQEQLGLCRIVPCVHLLTSMK